MMRLMVDSCDDVANFMGELFYGITGKNLLHYSFSYFIFWLDGKLLRVIVGIVSFLGDTELGVSSWLLLMMVISKKECLVSAFMVWNLVPGLWISLHMELIENVSRKLSDTLVCSELKIWTFTTKIIGPLQALQNIAEKNLTMDTGEFTNGSVVRNIKSLVTDRSV